MKLKNIIRQLSEYAIEAEHKLYDAFRWVKQLTEAKSLGEAYETGKEIPYEDIFAMMDPEKILVAMDVESSVKNPVKGIPARFRRARRITARHRRAV